MVVMPHKGMQRGKSSCRAGCQLSTELQGALLQMANAIASNGSNRNLNSELTNMLLSIHITGSLTAAAPPRRHLISTQPALLVHHPADHVRGIGSMALCLCDAVLKGAADTKWSCHQPTACISKQS